MWEKCWVSAIRRSFRRNLGTPYALQWITPWSWLFVEIGVFIPLIGLIFGKMLCSIDTDYQRPNMRASGLFLYSKSILLINFHHRSFAVNFFFCLFQTLVYRALYIMTYIDKDVPAMHVLFDETKAHGYHAACFALSFNNQKLAGNIYCWFWIYCIHNKL